MTTEMTTKKPSDIDCAYVAGLIDADGTMYVFKYSLQPKIEVALTNKNLIDWISSIFGGHLFQAQTGGTKKTGKVLYRVIWSSQDSCCEILIKVLPFLKLKQPQAKLLLLYCLGHIPFSRFKTIWEKEIHDELKRLNEEKPPSEKYFRLLEMAKKNNMPFF